MKNKTKKSIIIFKQLAAVKPISQFSVPNSPFKQEFQTLKLFFFLLQIPEIATESADFWSFQSAEP